MKKSLILFSFIVSLIAMHTSAMEDSNNSMSLRANTTITNNDERNALFKATRNNNLKMFQLLLQENQEKRIDSEKLRDTHGHTLLTCAASKNSIDVAHYILEIYPGLINVCTKKEKMSPLHQAVYKDSLQMVQLLLNNNADINLQNIFGVTPINEATYHGRTKILKTLLAKDARSINTPNKHRLTPLHVAMKKNHIDIVELLLEHGANPTIQSFLFTPVTPTTVNKKITKLIQHTSNDKQEDEEYFPTLHQYDSNTADSDIVIENYDLDQDSSNNTAVDNAANIDRLADQLLQTLTEWNNLVYSKHKNMHYQRLHSVSNNHNIQQHHYCTI